MFIFKKRKPKIHVICKNHAGYHEKTVVFDSLHGKYVKDQMENRYYLKKDGKFTEESASHCYGYGYVCWMKDKDQIEL